MSALSDTETFAVNSHYVTVLTSKGARLTKSFDLDTNEKSSYGNAKHFKQVKHDIEKLSSLYTLLVDLSEDKTSCVVNGAPVDTWTGFDHRNRETLQSRSISYLPLDIDNVDIGDFDPNNCKQSEVVKKVLEAIGLEWMAIYSYIWAWSSSVLAPGWKGNARIRLWFELDEALPLEQIKAWAKPIEGLDEAIYSPCQIIYTASPEFIENGKVINDLVHQRMGYEGGLLGELLPSNKIKPLKLVPKTETVDALDKADAETIKDLQSALTLIPADDYHTWIRVGQALASLKGTKYENDASLLYHEYSAKSDTYQEAETSEKWNSFTPSVIDYRAIFIQAQELGWVNPWSKQGKETNPIQKSILFDKSSPLSWAEAFTVSIEEAEKISDPDWVYENLIIQGHVVAIVAEPNGGKTTLLFHIAGELAKHYEVVYVNSDIAGGDAKPMVKEAKEKSFTLALPDMCGSTMSAVVENLQQMNELNEDYSRQVFIFDTLKKMTDVINKSKSKVLYELFRGLSAKGATIVLLGHTNKHKDSEGNPVYEGTGDLRADVDDLIYLIPEKRSDGSMIVSTKPDKMRGSFQPISFEFSVDREVTLLDSYIDTILSRSQSKQMADDESTIDVITEAIQAGKQKQIEIFEYCSNLRFGRRTVETVLKRYLEANRDGFNPKWKRQKGFDNNAWLYTLI